MTTGARRQAKRLTVVSFFSGNRLTRGLAAPGKAALEVSKVAQP